MLGHFLWAPDGSRKAFRAKGLVWLAGQPAPAVVQGVFDAFDVTTLPEASDAEESRVALIGVDLDAADLQRRFAACAVDAVADGSSDDAAAPADAADAAAPADDDAAAADDSSDAIVVAAAADSSDDDAIVVEEADESDASSDDDEIDAAKLRSAAAAAAGPAGYGVADGVLSAATLDAFCAEVLNAPYAPRVRRADASPTSRGDARGRGHSVETRNAAAGTIPQTSRGGAAAGDIPWRRGTPRLDESRRRPRLWMFRGDAAVRSPQVRVRRRGRRGARGAQALRPRARARRVPRSAAAERISSELRRASYERTPTRRRRRRGASAPRSCGRRSGARPRSASTPRRRRP